MLLIILPLALALPGTMGYFLHSCDFQECVAMLPQKEPYEPFLPTGQKLKDGCPSVLEALGCFKAQVKTCTGSSLSELVESDDKQDSNMAAFALDLEGVVTDLCDEDSSLHKAYVEKAECAREWITYYDPMKCSREATATYRTYVESLDSDQQVIDDVGKDFAGRTRHGCMMIGFTMACQGESLREACGEVAHDFYLTVLKRSKIIPRVSCIDKDLQDLKTKFLDVVTGGEERKNLYVLSFDVRRKK